MKICGIYCIENVLNGKKYVGQSMDCKKRIRTHKLNLTKNKSTSTYLQHAWNLYGESSFIFYMLEECEKENLSYLEKKYIVDLDSHISKNGYNISWGGESIMQGLKHSEESKEKMSRARKGKRRGPMSEEQKEKLSIDRRGSLHWNFGKKHRPETIEKMIRNNAHNKVVFTDEIKEKVANGIRGKNNKRKKGTEYRGVSFHSASNKWRARIGDNHKEIYLGIYSTPEEAAKAYDKYVWKTYKRKDILNFPNDYEQ